MNSACRGIRSSKTESQTIERLYIYLSMNTIKKCSNNMQAKTIHSPELHVSPNTEMVTLRVQGTDFVINRHLLIAKSGFFAAYFSERWNPDNDQKLVELDLEADIFAHLYYYFCNGRLLNQTVNMEKCWEMLTMARYLDIEEIENAISVSFTKRIRVDFVFYLWENANQHNLKSLMVICEDFIIQNFAVVALMDDFLCAPKELIYNIVKKGNIKEDVDFVMWALEEWGNQRVIEEKLEGKDSLQVVLRDVLPPNTMLCEDIKYALMHDIM
eukprot:TRINITY_DN1337_c0_g1_i1.p1 TRINITY_DN1337_c0_g1~~TRINITY_DN1337_c0_g1_i1.p1  ORF type:complete len:270 (-),score=52.27 TRINITY_DN1337_c0_g1_i1:26-835(-)